MEWLNDLAPEIQQLSSQWLRDVCYTVALFTGVCVRAVSCCVVCDSSGGWQKCDVISKAHSCQIPSPICHQSAAWIISGTFSTTFDCNHFHFFTLRISSVATLLAWHSGVYCQSICDGNWSWQNLFIYHIKYFISSFALGTMSKDTHTHTGRDKVEGGWKIIRIDQCQDGIAS